ARTAIINTKPTEAELEGARATLALAERDLNKTVVRAPCDGRITALDIAAGEFAATGHPLFTIIDTEHWYAIGNFRETDLAGIKPGQRATVFVMAQPRLPLRGTVDSLGWGVASGVSATFGGLPHVESTLNWVRIAARFPVRVLLDEPPEDLMRLSRVERLIQRLGFSDSLERANRSDENGRQVSGEGDGRAGEAAGGEGGRVGPGRGGQGQKHP